MSKEVTPSQQLLSRKTPGCNNFWVAANKNPESLIGPFLRDILSMLPDCNEALRLHLEQLVFEKAVEFGKKRILAYRQLIEKSVEKCIQILWNEDHKRSKSKIFLHSI